MAAVKAFRLIFHSYFPSFIPPLYHSSWPLSRRNLASR
ncbi:hypothetical protein MelnitzEXVC044M_140 [Methylophilales phage Melnitz EXVC044M]|nr:hypothetical protein Melnitz1EXVC043M_139 [Methylophilales phage Melnitz-1 EXVC043M]QZI94646.1 hypothetical protein Melnitz2EXVC040M_140 [Methylophilales phage Melnitz-2 EXVC040M]QZI94868.1 hypothetical protein MelnitzEXVC044M_140 [Methylophilales phage Melnitz EXVC044M]QZI95089.1 hypothetical protein Melnitz3EXVC039M_140 [Methylophilales phage Melnitz-3 EXVC039M]